VSWQTTLAAWLPLVAALGAFAYFRSHGGGGALQELERANKVLEGRLGELGRENRNLAQVVGALEQRTNLEPIAAAVVEQFVAHEKRAQQRHEGQLVVLELIAERLGPDPNGRASAA
jgi:hypothetical protein